MKIENLYGRFGAELMAARLRFGMTHTEVGKMLGLTRVSVANIEAGRQRILFHHAALLSARFGFSLDSLRPTIRVEE